MAYHINSLALLSLFRSTHAASPCSQAVDGYHHEADEGKDERYVYGGHTDKGAAVDDGSLERGQNATAKDGHAESGCTKLGVIAESCQCNTVNRGEHQRHAGAYSYEAIEAHTVLQEYHANCQSTTSDGEKHQQSSRIDVAKEEGADES